MGEQIKIKVATFNTGDFSGGNMAPGSEASRAAFGQIFDKVGAELWALQEDVEFFCKETKELPFDAIYKSRFPHCGRYGTGPYNFKAFLSNLPLIDVEPVFYTGNMRFRHPWYLRGKVNIGGKEIALICLHFDWSDRAVRAEQITQVLSYGKEQEYCIIMGDFNPEDRIDDGKKVSDRLLFTEEFGRFQEAGFCIANGDAFGTFDTILDTDISPCPYDNIMVTPNIRITAAGQVAEPWMNDHALLWAELLIG